MSRIASFADGFTSATAPTLEGASQDDYTLLNNQASATDVTGLVFSSVEYKSAFLDFTLTRSDDTPLLFTQTGSAIASYDGSTWSLEFGNFIGDSLIQDTLTNDEHVILSITGVGQVQYQTGNMGTGHSCELSISSIRILA